MIVELQYDQILIKLGPAFWRKFRSYFWGRLHEKYCLKFTSVIQKQILPTSRRKKVILHYYSLQITQL